MIALEKLFGGQQAMVEGLVRYSRVQAIVGDILQVQVQVPEAREGDKPVVKFNDLAIVKDENGRESLAQVINIVRDSVSLQSKMVAAGYLGRKSGRGFFEYRDC